MKRNRDTKEDAESKTQASKFRSPIVALVVVVVIVVVVVVVLLPNTDNKKMTSMDHSKWKRKNTHGLVDETKKYLGDDAMITGMGNGDQKEEMSDKIP